MDNAFAETLELIKAYPFATIVKESIANTERFVLDSASDYARNVKRTHHLRY